MIAAALDKTKLSADLGHNFMSRNPLTLKLGTPDLYTATDSLAKALDPAMADQALAVRAELALNTGDGGRAEVVTFAARQDTPTAPPYSTLGITSTDCASAACLRSVANLRSGAIRASALRRSVMVMPIVVTTAASVMTASAIVPTAVHAAAFIDTAAITFAMAQPHQPAAARLCGAPIADQPVVPPLHRVRPIDIDVRQRVAPQSPAAALGWFGGTATTGTDGGMSRSRGRVTSALRSCSSARTRRATRDGAGLG